VKEGGELCLSDTNNGTSVLRYWPKFLSERGNTMMFNKLRRYCKWHQKQVRYFWDLFLLRKQGLLDCWRGINIGLCWWSYLQETVLFCSLFLSRVSFQLKWGKAKLGFRERLRLLKLRALRQFNSTYFRSPQKCTAMPI